MQGLSMEEQARVWQSYTDLNTLANEMFGRGEENTHSYKELRDSVNSLYKLLSMNGWWH